MDVTAFDLAQRFVGVKETPGVHSTPVVLAMLKLDGEWPTDDAVPWCSAFVNAICWLLRLPRSKSLAARSWLQVGASIPLASARPGYDVVVLARGAGGHVGFYAGVDVSGTVVFLLGGNQHDGVNVAPFPVEHILGVRRIDTGHW
jgi:uncharacterized protein (TIGR02594 family)